MNTSSHPFRNLLFVLFSVALWDKLLAEDNQLLVIDDIATNFPGEHYLIGDIGTNNWLIITNGGTATGDIWVGNDVTANDNGVLITGNGSSCPGGLTLGVSGSRNNLVISDGGQLRGYGIIGKSETSFSNAAVVDGENSLLEIETLLEVGIGGSSSNQLLVINGGNLNTEGGMIGHGWGTNNLVHITGEGSVWNGLGSIWIGFFGANNQLIVSNGGQLTNRNWTDGRMILGQADIASGNTVNVTGAGARIDADRIDVGHNGSSNLFFVNDGGTLMAGDVYVGGEGGRSNTLCVSGSNSTAIVENGLYVGHYGSDSSLRLLDEGRLISGDVYLSGESNYCLISGGAVLQSQAGHLGIHGSSDNKVTVTGIGSAWINSSEIVFDSGSRRIVLNIENGGQVRSSQMTIDSSWPSESNRVEVIDGHLIVTNQTGTGTLEIPHGSLVLKGGSINADRLYVSSLLGRITFERGLLLMKQAEITNGVPFIVGDGINPAILQLEGGTFNFAAGLVISSNAILRGYGTILNNVTNYGTIAANQSGQKITFDAYLSNQGQMLATNGGGFFEITSLTRSAGSAQISLKGIQGMEFALEYKNSLLDDFWTTLLPFSPGTNGTMVLTDQAAPQSTRIYRVQAR